MTHSPIEQPSVSPEELQSLQAQQDHWEDERIAWELRQQGLSEEEITYRREERHEYRDRQRADRARIREIVGMAALNLDQAGRYYNRVIQAQIDFNAGTPYEELGLDMPPTQTTH